MAKRRVVSRERFVDPGKAAANPPSRPGETRRVTGAHSVVASTHEASWECKSCGRKNGGFTKRCAGCGNPKDSEEEYYADDSRPALSAAELQEAGVTANHASDEYCPYCNARVRPGSITCPNCGSQIDPSAADKLHEVAAPPRAQASRISQPALPTPLPTNWWMYAIGAAVVLVLIVGLVMALWPHEAKLTVESVAWQRTVQLEERQYNQHEGWSLPSGADLLSQESRFHHNEQILDHYKDVPVQVPYEVPDGYEDVCHDVEVFDHNDSVYDYSEKVTYDDGSSETIDYYRDEAVYRTELRCEKKPKFRTEYKTEIKKEPVYIDVPRYATWYVYRIWKWSRVAPATASGSGNSPFWPEFTADANHREAGRSESYKVVFTDGKELTREYNPSTQKEFAQYTLGSVWKVRYNSLVVTEVLEVIER